MALISSTTQILPSGVRLLGAGRTVCAVCDRDVRQVMEHPGRRVTRLLVGVHGPADHRCPGSRELGKTFHEAAHLPVWDALDDHDKGEALMFAHKVSWERDYAYARENYPPAFTHPLLVEVAAIPAGEYVGGTYWTCRYAFSVVGSLGVPLESVPNPWAASPTVFHREPQYVRESLIGMACRVLGAEADQLLNQGAAAAAAGEPR